MDLGFRGNFTFLGKKYEENPFKIIFVNDIFKQVAKMYEDNFNMHVETKDVKELNLANDLPMDWSKIRKPILLVGYILGKILRIVGATFEIIADILEVVVTVIAFSFCDHRDALCYNLLITYKEGNKANEEKELKENYCYPCCYDEFNTCCYYFNHNASPRYYF